MDRIRIARELVRIARRLTAGASPLVKMTYRVMDKASNQVGVCLEAKPTTESDKVMGFLDYALSEYGKVFALAGKYQFEKVDGMMDMKAIQRVRGGMPSVSLVVAGKDGCDLEGFLQALASTYGAEEIK